MPVQTKIQIRRDTAANWTSTNPTLASGEIGFETDTNKLKIGNGSTLWASLAMPLVPMLTGLTSLESHQHLLRLHTPTQWQTLHLLPSQTL